MEPETGARSLPDQHTERAEAKKAEPKEVDQGWRPATKITVG